MSKDVQSATVRGVGACGATAEQLKSQGTSHLWSAKALLRAFWQCPNSVDGFFRQGINLDLSDQPLPMDADAIEGLLTLLRLAERSAEEMARVFDRAMADVPDLWPVTQVLKPAIDILEVASRVDDGALSPSIAYAVWRLVDEAADQLDDIEIVSPMQEAA
jgi:hypothetical protein